MGHVSTTSWRIIIGERMSPRVESKGPWWRYIDWRVFVPVLVAGGALHYYPERWLVSGVVHGLSEAMMIAAVLGLTVDRVAKDKLLSDVSSDIWHHLMGRDLPVEIKGFIRHALLETRLVCTRLEIRYRLEEREDGRLDVYVTQTRDMEHFSSAPVRDWEGYKTVFNDYAPKYLSCVYEIPDGQGFAWPDDPTAVTLEDKDSALTARPRKITFAPYGEKGSKVVTTWRFSMVMRRTDTDINVFGGAPSIGLTIILDGKPDSIDFKVDGVPPPVGHIWRTSDVIWQGQFRRLRWFDRSA